MSKKLIYLTIFVFVLSLVGMASAQEPDIIIRSPDQAMPIIDGVVEDVWLVATEQEMPFTIAGSYPSWPGDCSGKWKVLWNWEHIYVLAVVKDEVLYNDSGIPNSWMDDSIEFYIDGDNSKKPYVDEDDHQYTFRWNIVLERPRAHHHGAPSLVGTEYAIVTSGDGYLFEIRIPWTSITTEPPVAGDLIGIDMFINDDDNGGGRDTQISWYSTAGSGWNTPSMWGTARLVPGKKAGAPKPLDGSKYTNSWVNISWTPGSTAVTHDIYFGDNFDDVNNGFAGTFQGNQTATSFNVGLPGGPYPDGLVLDTTYYWRIDEVEEDGTTVHKGDVWSFTVCMVEDFETSDFSKFSWSSSGEQSWETTRSERHSGFFSAGSGSIEDFESTTLGVSLDCISGDITFYCKVSSEPRHDNLKFKIDGVEKGTWSGEEDWSEVSFPVDEGTRTFEWTYSKDGSDSEGDDTAWIDDIVFPIGL